MAAFNVFPLYKSGYDCNLYGTIKFAKIKQQKNKTVKKPKTLQNKQLRRNTEIKQGLAPSILNVTTLTLNLRMKPKSKKIVIYFDGL